MPITTCDSPEALRTEIETVRKKISLDETEDTWDTIAQSILHLTCLCKNGGCEFPSEMAAGIRSVSRPLNNALNSERSRLSGAAVELLTALAIGLGSSFDLLVSQFIPNLLSLCGRTNKVFTSRARACILTVVQHTRLPSLLPYLADMVNHKSVFPRLIAAEGILACLNCFNPPDLEKEARARVVEDFIRLTARDASADVRKASKEIFKAYKILMPARVDNFVAPLTPVVKKYLDIQTGPSGSHGTSSNMAQKQSSSRPSSRANNKVTEAGPANLANSKPPTRQIIDPVRSTQQQPAARRLPTDICAPRQRVISQMQRDPSMPRNLLINTQSSGVAQRCVVSTSIPSRQAVQHPQTKAARVPSVPKAGSTGGPQRPPPVQIKFNPPPDRLKVTGVGAKRIPLPPVPVNGPPSEQVAVVTDLGAIVDKPRPKPPSRNTEAVMAGKEAVVRKAPDSTRSTTSSIKPINKSALTGPAVAQRSHQRTVKGETANSRTTAPQRRPAGDVPKGARPPVKTERKETSPTLLPLPPSPATLPTEIPLPPSPDCTLHLPDLEGRKEPVVETSSGTTTSAELEACSEQGDMGDPSTPITALLSSIQRGFLFTPSSPLSPPQNYLTTRRDLLEKGQNTVTVGRSLLPLGVAFCITPEDDPEGLDRHALRDLN